MYLSINYSSEILVLVAYCLSQLQSMLKDPHQKKFLFLKFDLLLPHVNVYANSFHFKHKMSPMCNIGLQLATKTVVMLQIMFVDDTCFNLRFKLST